MLVFAGIWLLFEEQGLYICCLCEHVGYGEMERSTVAFNRMLDVSGGEQSRRDGSVPDVTVTQLCGPEFGSQNLCLKNQV